MDKRSSVALAQIAAMKAAVGAFFVDEGNGAQRSRVISTTPRHGTNVCCLQFTGTLKSYWLVFPAASQAVG
jgi:hypothetical protein